MAHLSSSEVSHQDFQSQVPFQTQYHRVEGSRATQVTGKSNTQWLKQSRVAQDSLAEDAKSPTASDTDTPEHEVTSSGGSIACEPLTAPQTAVKSGVRTFSPTQRSSVQQPFPLVDWIRRIRDETEVEHPTLPLRWCRSISRQQQAVLDTDDAWCPPLPGRPVRQGTVPIEILQALTDQVDHDVQAKRNVAVQLASHVARRTSPTHSVMEQLRTTQSSLPSPVLTIPSASQAESVVAWSSSPPSPPRRLLPPDTSPIRPASKHGQNFSNIGPSKMPVGKSDMGTPAQLSTMRETMPSPPADAHLLQSMDEIWSKCPGTASQRARMETRDGRTKRSTQQDVLRSHARENVPSTSFMQPPKTVIRRKSEILVKHTPYPLKVLAKNHDYNPAIDQLPGSSLVTGTYPDTISDNRKSSFARRLEPMTTSQSLPAYTPVLQSNENLTEMEDRPSQRSLKRTHKEVDHEAAAILQNTFTTQKRANGSIPDEVGDRSKRSKTFHSRSRSAASETLEQPESSSDPEYKARLEGERIQRKIERRRAVRREMSKKKPEHTAENLQSPAPMQVQERALTPSVASSTRSGRANGTILQSDHNKTRTTAVSQRGVPYLDENPEPAGLSQMSSQATSNRDTYTKLFQHFILTYPNYKGNSQSFEVALRLLSSHNLHQSLFDDFIFRMAEEYQVYRQECFERDEDVLSYRNYYDSHVEESECRNKAITRKDLENLAAHLKGSFTTPRKAPSVIPSEVFSSTICLRTPGPPDPHRGIARPTVHEVEQLQPSPVSQGAPSAERTPTADHARQVRGSEANFRSGSNREIRKRRSLPWASDIRPEIEAAVVIQPTQTDISAVPTESEDLTTSVENWLSRPAGACSPEIEVAPVRTPAVKDTSLNTDVVSKFKESKIDNTQRKSLEVSEPRVPSHLTIKGVTSIKDYDNTSPTTVPSTTARDIVAFPAEKAVTPFQLFARTFANLQSEKPMPDLPINVYNW